MAHSFAYSTESIIGTIKFGNLVVGNPVPVTGYTNSPAFFMGPDEDNRYVIATTLSGQTQPTPAAPPNDYSYVTFWATSTRTIPELIDLSEYCSDWYGDPQTFSTPFDAKMWLNANGFWVNWPS